VEHIQADVHVHAPRLRCECVQRTLERRTACIGGRQHADARPLRRRRFRRIQVARPDETRTPHSGTCEFAMSDICWTRARPTDNPALLMRTMRFARLFAIVAVLPILAEVAPLFAQSSPAAIHSDSLAASTWRNIGPDRGGRWIAGSGVKGRRNEAYFGATGGGLWKTTDGGQYWRPVTDFQIG